MEMPNAESYQRTYDHIQHKPTVIETRKSSYHYKSFLKMNSC